MSIEAGWYEVDESGHVPYVAAELPPGHRVLLDAAGNIGAIVPIEVQEEPVSSEGEMQDEAPPGVEEAGQQAAAGFFATPPLEAGG